MKKKYRNSREQIEFLAKTFNFAVDNFNKALGSLLKRTDKTTAEIKRLGIELQKLEKKDE